MKSCLLKSCLIDLEEEEDFLSEDDQDILEEIGIIIQQEEERFLGKILNKQKNADAMHVMRLDTMLMNVQINLIKRKLRLMMILKK